MAMTILRTLEFFIRNSPLKWWYSYIPFLVAGAGVGIGLVFSGLITATSRNPALRPQLFSYAILGFALSEATG